MGQAKQRKLAGTYPVQDGRQPMKEQGLRRAAKPGCRICGGSGVVHYNAGQPFYCSCAMRQLDKQEAADKAAADSLQGAY